MSETSFFLGERHVNQACPKDFYMDIDCLKSFNMHCNMWMHGFDGWFCWSTKTRSRTRWTNQPTICSSCHQHMKLRATRRNQLYMQSSNYSRGWSCLHIASISSNNPQNQTWPAAVFITSPSSLSTNTSASKYSAKTIAVCKQRRKGDVIITWLRVHRKHQTTLTYTS